MLAIRQMSLAYCWIVWSLETAALSRSTLRRREYPQRWVAGGESAGGFRGSTSEDTTRVGNTYPLPSPRGRGQARGAVHGVERWGVAFGGVFILSWMAVSFQGLGPTGRVKVQYSSHFTGVVLLPSRTWLLAFLDRVIQQAGQEAHCHEILAVLLPGLLHLRRAHRNVLPGLTRRSRRS